LGDEKEAQRGGGKKDEVGGIQNGQRRAWKRKKCITGRDLDVREGNADTKFGKKVREK